MSDQTLTEASLEVLAAQRRVIEHLRELAFPDQIGQPIEQDAMRRLLALAEEQAVARAALRSTPAAPHTELCPCDECRANGRGYFAADIAAKNDAEWVSAYEKWDRSTPAAPKEDDRE